MSNLRSDSLGRMSGKALPIILIGLAVAGIIFLFAGDFLGGAENDDGTSDTDVGMEDT